MFIKVANKGVLDVPTACNMLGASVKEKEGAIGIFGSGLKYALAQACRQGIQLHIASGNNIFAVKTKPVEFRGKIFQKVILVEVNSGKSFETPITTDFGSQDWNELWFIYREIVCNALDEKENRISVVKEIRRCSDETAFYLPYEVFAEIYNRHDSFFSKQSGEWIKVGSGIIYKRGVRVGQINGLNIDYQLNEVGITETRTVKEYDAMWRIGYMISKNTDANVWASILKSEKRSDILINISGSSPEIIAAFNKGAKQAFGEYAIAPNMENVIKDLLTIGIHPLVVPTGWILPVDKLPNFKDKISLENSDVRKPNDEEKKVLAWGLEAAAAFGMNTDITVRVFSSNLKPELLGLRQGSIINIPENTFKDRKEFLFTLFHEIGHMESGAGDYDRGFSNFFVTKMVNFVLS